MGFDGLQQVTTDTRSRVCRQAEERALAGAINVSVQQTDAGAIGGESDCQVRGDRGFADATLAGGDRNNVAYGIKLKLFDFYLADSAAPFRKWR